MLRTKHRKHQKRKHNYTVREVRHVRRDCVFVDFESREDGSIYRVSLEVGMNVHIDFHMDPTRGTAGTSITPVL